MQDLLDTNQYVLEETFTAKSAEVFQHLTRLGSVYSLGCDCATGPSRTETSTSVKFGVGFAWREHRRQLFLREVTDCEVTHCQAPVALRIITSDGFNQLEYDFGLMEVESCATAVRCTVHCYTRPNGQGQYASPSEKLAIMMHNQDRLAIRQLKGAMEAGHALPVC